MKEKKKVILAEVVNSHPAMRAFTASSTQTEGKSTESVNFTSVKTHFTGKMIITASKRYFSFVVPQLDGGVFSTFAARRQRL